MLSESQPRRVRDPHGLPFALRFCSAMRGNVFFRWKEDLRVVSRKFLHVRKFVRCSHRRLLRHATGESIATGLVGVSAIGDALSCSSEHSSALMTDSRDGIVLAGFAGEAAFLSALVDAFHRNHKVTYLCDASASHAFGDVPADEFTALFLKYPGFMGDVYETDDWITSALPRKIGSANYTRV